MGCHNKSLINLRVMAITERSFQMMTKSISEPEINVDMPAKGMHYLSITPRKVTVKLQAQVS